jgi:hypothetical protein
MAPHVAVGWGGNILHYDGSIWSKMWRGTTQILYDVWRSPDRDVFAVDEDGTILHSRYHRVRIMCINE